MFRISRSKLHFLLLSSVVFWAPLILLSGIANEVTESKPLAGDIRILHYIHSHFSPRLSDLFLAATNVGSALGIVVMTAILIAALVYRKKYLPAAVLLFSVAGSSTANLIIKLLFKRQRPSLWHSIIHEQSFSFPSGHAMASSALVFSLIFISWRTRFRWPVVVLGSAFMLAVGLSRLYFGVHYPSDVLAGWLASLIWVVIVAVTLTRPGLARFFESRRQAVVSDRNDESSESCMLS
jgi:membrane-associated phospholipid phosphatase